MDYYKYPDAKHILDDVSVVVLYGLPSRLITVSLSAFACDLGLTLFARTILVLLC